ncbi:MAG: hypothetical protein JJT94_14405 [Bernardetiaceae bacterium]|nr:hypothetical protein [Bernardetiaceae bacterium]
MKSTYLIIVASILLVIFAGAYYLMGGFEKPELTIEEHISLYMVGTYYEGKLDNNAYREKVAQAQKLAQDERITGTFSLYYYDNPDFSTNPKVFVGLVVSDTLQAFPQDYEVRKYNFEKAIQAEMRTHVMFAPSPQAVNEQIKNFAKAQNLFIKTEYLDQVFDNSHIRTLVRIDVERSQESEKI